jgi:hypothetical protein
VAATVGHVFKTARSVAALWLAVAAVWLALILPNQPGSFEPAAFLRIPIEGLLLVAMLLLVRGTARRVLAIAAGIALGLLVLTKLLDLGFYAALDHPFNPLVDWGSFGPALGLIRDSIGRGGQIGAVVLVVVLVPAILVLLTWSSLRLERACTGHRVRLARGTTALGCVWLLCAATGIQVVSGTPVASASAAGLVVDRVRDVSAEFRDRQAFAEAIRTDPMADVPADRLVNGLRGKDVLMVFVESYGRSAVQDSAFSPSVAATLADGEKRLEAAGYSTRSAFMTSPAFGAGSWLAHASVHTGLWVENQSRYNQLLPEERRTLMSTFGEAGWRTVLQVPANTSAWPEGQEFYQVDQMYDANNVGYRGPRFGYPTMPDQYTLSAFEERELRPADRTPVMAEIDLISSHASWIKLPTMVDPDEVGDGSVFEGMPERGQTKQEVWRSTESVQASYATSINYSLDALFTFIERSSNDDLVLIVMGDHQPARIVSGEDADNDVPVSVIASDPAVLDAVDSWAWQDGLHPDPAAPVWRMDEFRDRFFDAFSEGPGGAG